MTAGLRCGNALKLLREMWKKVVTPDCRPRAMSISERGAMYQRREHDSPYNAAFRKENWR